MHKFDYSKLKSREWPKEIVNYVGLIHEHKGRQDLYLNQKPDELKTLVEIAKRQSTEASNAIEGIKTKSYRLVKLMNEKAAPINRDEKEILGYRNVLNMIHESYKDIIINSSHILQLHKVMYRQVDVNYGGKFKDITNVIEQINADGSSEVIFKPLEPYETPEAVRVLCEQYNKAITAYNIDPLIVIPIFIHDFLCIHPFTDGNGRMSRLLTTLLLYKSGYEIGKYISLEKLIQKSKEDYYDSLSYSSKNWHTNKNDEIDFIKYLLGVILAAYRDFEERVNLVSKKMSAFDMVVKAVNNKIGKFTKNDIVELCPEIKRASVENALNKLAKKKIIEKCGGGRSTYYIKLK